MSGWEVFTGVCQHAETFVARYVNGTQLTRDGHPGRISMTQYRRCHPCGYNLGRVEVEDMTPSDFARMEVIVDRSCSHPRHRIALVEATTVSGKVQWSLRCEACRARTILRATEARQLLKRGAFRHVIGLDRRLEVPPCERCGADGAELNHYAPRHLFDDADDWAMGYLCPPCHTEWHRRTRTGAFARVAS